MLSGRQRGYPALHERARLPPRTGPPAGGPGADGPPALAAARRAVDDRSMWGGAALHALAGRRERTAEARARGARAPGARRQRLARDHAVPDQWVSPARDAAGAGRLEL